MHTLEYTAYAAFVAGNTGEDIFWSALCELVRHVGVGNEAAADHGVVANAVAQGGGGLFVVGKAPVCQHGDGNGLPHSLGALELHYRLLIEHGGHGQLPLLIAAGVHVQGVNTVFLEVLGEFKSLGQLTEARVLNAVVGAELDKYRYVFAGASAHSGNLFEQESGAALNISAVFVGAGVPRGGEELVIQISAISVHLKRICTCFCAELGGAFGLSDEALYLLDGKLVALHARRVEPTASGGAYRDGVNFAGSGHAPVARHELNADLAADLVRAVAYLLEILEVVLVDDQGSAGVLKVVRNGHVDQYHSGSAASASREVLHCFSVYITEMWPHWRHDDAVFEFQRANLARGHKIQHYVLSL